MDVIDLPFNLLSLDSNKMKYIESNESNIFNTNINNNTIKFQIAKINDYNSITYINDDEIPSENDSLTLITKVAMTEYETIYAILPIIYIKQEIIDLINEIYKYLLLKFSIDLVSKIVKNIIDDMTSINMNEYEIHRIYYSNVENNIDIDNYNLLNLHSGYMMNNSLLNIDPDIEYTKEYVKELIINEKVLLGSKNSFSENSNIFIMDHEDSEYVNTFFKLSESEKYKAEWRQFSSCLDLELE